MFLYLWLALLSASAHPFGSKLYGHKTEVRLSAESVDVTYMLEIPTPVLLAELREFWPILMRPLRPIKIGTRQRPSPSFRTGCGSWLTARRCRG